MYLQKCILVNWGNIPAGEFEFGPVNLLSGGNGSGKTTAADAIQALMTAAHDTLFQFNPGQEEATQRGRGKQVRTLASYVLGCDDGSYARPHPTVGYLAAVFGPTRGESGEPFTAVLGLSARLETHGDTRSARLQDQQFYLVPGEALTLDDFLATEAREVLPLNRFNRSLKQRLGGDGPIRLETKKSYLRHLYGALRGRTEPVTEREALHAARAFSRFMAYKPVRSIHEFVAGEILEPHDLGDAIRSVSDLMKTIHAMDAEASRLHAGVERLDSAEREAGQYQEQWLNRQLERFTLTQARFRKDQTAYLNAKRAQSELRDALAEAGSRRELIVTQREALRQEQIRLEAERMGVPELRDRADREHQAQTLAETLATDRRRLEGGARQADAYRQSDTLLAGHGELLSDSIAGAFPNTDLSSLWQARQALAGACETLETAIGRLGNTDWIDASDQDARVRHLHEAENSLNRWYDHWHETGRHVPEMSLRDALARLIDRSQQAAAVHWQDWQRQEQAQRELAAGRPDYPGFVRAALAMLQEQLPEARPSVLCDHVQLRVPEWQPVVEAYLGAARFTLLVEPELEARAAELLREADGAAGRARVAQGEQARRDAQQRPAGSDSLPALLACDHPVAEAYLSASYGTVRCVDSVEALRRTRRGIARQGLGSGGYAMFRCHLPASDLVFGQQAREHARARQEDSVLALGAAWEKERQRAEHLVDCLTAVDALSRLHLYPLAQQLISDGRNHQRLQDELAGLGTAQYRSLDEERERLQEQAGTLDQEARALDAETGRLEEQLRQCDRLCRDLSDQQERTEAMAEQASEDLTQLHTDWPAFDLGRRLQDAEDQAGQADTDALESALATSDHRMTQQVRSLEQAVADHNQHSTTGDGIVFSPDFTALHSRDFFGEVTRLRNELTRQHERLRHHVLVDKLDQIGRLRDSFNDTFVTNLCHAIFHAIDEGKRALEALNQELAHHRFGSDRERYWFDWSWVPEFQEYWRFFREVAEAPGLGEKQTLFTLPLSDRSSRVRDRLLNMLLDSDEERAHRELARIADYRNYRAYEIYKQPEGKDPIALSRYGTGSGGQLETPAYIIRAAAITSAYQFAQGDTHLRMVLVDEAFSKMDEARSREVIRYLTESLGLQLLFIMPTSKSGPFMDLISHQFVFAKVPLQAGDRIGELGSRVLVDRQRLNRERIQALWANHRRVIRRQAELDFMAAFE